MQLGFNLKEFRISKNLTQEELAKKIGKSKGVISNWEKGINRPDADTIGQICKIFSITPNELFGWDENSQVENTNNSSTLIPEIIKNYEKLDDDHKKFIEKQIIMLIDLQNNKNNE